MSLEIWSISLKIATNWVSVRGLCLVYDSLCHVATDFRETKFGLYVSDMLWICLPPVGISPFPKCFRVFVSAI